MRRLALLLAVTAAAGCAGHTTPDRELVARYFAEANAAADRGPGAQQRFFAATRHPDLPGAACPPPGVIVRTDPALSTLRPDPDWTPGTAGTPRGTVYVVAGTVTAVKQPEGRQDTQIGSQHVVVLDGTAYGFPPCAA